MWLHEVSLCSVCIWVCVEIISLSDMGRGLYFRAWGGLCMQWETKDEKGSTLQFQVYHLQWAWMHVTRIRCLVMSKKNQPETVFSRFPKPLILCFLPLLCKISGQIIADVYLWKRISCNHFEPEAEF